MAPVSTGEGSGGGAVRLLPSRVRSSRILSCTVALAALLSLPGCWVRVDSHPRHVEERFGAALEEVAKLQAIPAADRGRPRHVRLLVYDRGDDQLITLSVPMWLVRRVAAHATEGDREGGDDAALARVARHGLTWDQILDGGRGTTIQTDEDDEKMLLWLE